VVGRGRRVPPLALAELLRGWPELAGWWPMVGDPEDPIRHTRPRCPRVVRLGHPGVVAALCWCCHDPERRATFEAALRSRGRGRPRDIRLSRAFYLACEAVRREREASSFKAWESVSLDVAQLCVRWADVVGLANERETAWEQPSVTDTWPRHLAPLMRVLLHNPPTDLTDWLEQRIADGKAATEETGRPWRPWSREAVRHHDEVYRDRLWTLWQLGLRSLGSVLKSIPEEARHGYPHRPLFEEGAGVTTAADGVELVEVASFSVSAAPFRSSGKHRSDTGHRDRSR
jgi:hypothetical protein